VSAARKRALARVLAACVPRVLAACLLGVGAAVAVSACGSSNAKLIPVADSEPLQSDFESVAQAAETADGNCANTEAALLKTEQDFNELPSSVDAGLRARLREGIAKLHEDALSQCAKTSSSSTGTSSTAKTSTGKTTTTQTQPTTSTETQTTTTQTTPPSTETTSTETTTTPGGGTQVPEEGATGAGGQGGGTGAGEGGTPGGAGEAGAGPGGGTGNSPGAGNGGAGTPGAGAQQALGGARGHRPHGRWRELERRLERAR